MIWECAAVGCSTLTMGQLCLDHERELELDLRSVDVLDPAAAEVVDEVLPSGRAG
jgi:hypothetical protein